VVCGGWFEAFCRGLLRWWFVWAGQCFRWVAWGAFLGLTSVLCDHEALGIVFFVRWWFYFCLIGFVFCGFFGCWGCGCGVRCLFVFCYVIWVGGVVWLGSRGWWVGLLFHCSASVSSPCMVGLGVWMVVAFLGWVVVLFFILGLVVVVGCWFVGFWGFGVCFGGGVVCGFFVGGFLLGECVCLVCWVFFVVCFRFFLSFVWFWCVVFGGGRCVGLCCVGRCGCVWCVWVVWSGGGGVGCGSSGLVCGGVWGPFPLIVSSFPTDLRGINFVVL